MTKEELKQEAEEKYFNHKMMEFQGFYNRHYYYLGYLDSAEPREKRIAELEKANEWHYVKDGDLPNTETKNYTYIRRRKRNERRFTDYRVIKCFVLCLNEKGKTTAEVGYFDCNQKCFLDEPEGIIYAWREIVLPEESE